ncbi:MAG: IS1096 element passenger TnpR family protein [Flavobacteriaceae bacterium]
MIYRIRAILDTETDVIRDFEIEATATLEELHDAVSQSFGFAGNEMASFYRSDENWAQGEELPLVDMGVGEKPLNEKPLNKVLSENENRLIYVYDFLNLWTFFVELMETAEKDHLKGYPSLIFYHGEVPETPPDKDFVAQEGFHNELTEDEDSNENEFDEDQFY